MRDKKGRIMGKPYNLLSRPFFKCCTVSRRRLSWWLPPWKSDRHVIWQHQKMNERAIQMRIAAKNCWRPWAQDFWTTLEHVVIGVRSISMRTFCWHWDYYFDVTNWGVLFSNTNRPFLRVLNEKDISPPGMIFTTPHILRMLIKNHIS